MYGVELGSIGCHSSCFMCNGTSSNNCQICRDSSYFLYMGTCYKQCPQKASFYKSIPVVFQSITYSQNQCVEECPLQFYPDPHSGHCLACN